MELFVLGFIVGGLITICALSVFANNDKEESEKDAPVIYRHWQGFDYEFIDTVVHPNGEIWVLLRGCFDHHYYYIYPKDLFEGVVTDYHNNVVYRFRKIENEN